MPKVISAAEQHEIINMILTKDHTGTPIFSQRAIEEITGYSRPYIRKLAKTIGYKFPKNGEEIVGQLCICSNCSVFFRKAPSRANRAKNKFCCVQCKVDYSKGINHSSWIDGRASNTFSKWVKNQKGYKEFRQAVLERDGYKCAITGSTENLDVHHVRPKAEGENPELAMDIHNGVTISEPVHLRIHALIREGLGFEEAIDKVKEEFKEGKLVCQTLQK
jgi:5-methylcytosine-specific restriction endonuclease McrA